MRTTSKPTTTVDIEVPPQGGNLALAGSLEEEAHALRVMLDRSENMKVAVGQKLLELLNSRFAGNRNALRDWYEAEVYEGKEHRAWETVRKYLGIVRVHGEYAAAELERQEEWDRQRNRQHQQDLRRDAQEFRQAKFRLSNDDNRGGRQTKGEYELRSDWLATMDYHWFKGKPEWQNKWLSNRGLRRND